MRRIPETTPAEIRKNKDNANTDNAPAPTAVPAESAGTNITTQAVQTGDNMDVAAIIWSLVLLAAVAGAGVLVYFHRRRTDEPKSK